MIVTYWKGIFVVDKAENKSVLKQAGFVLHEPSLCAPANGCKACRANIGPRYWANNVEAATRLKPYCNGLALAAMRKHLDKLAQSRAVSADLIVPAPPGLAYLPYQKAGIAFMLSHKDVLNGDDMGLGKDQPLDAKLLTPNGWIRMGEVQVGDKVLGSDGKAHRVTGVFPQGMKMVYRVSFQDGSSTECGEEHLWEVNTPLRKSRGCAPRIWTTRQIIDDGLIDGQGNRKHHIKIVKPCQFPERQHLIHPYVMGYLLGNGGLSQGSVHVTAPDEESVTRLNKLLPAPYFLTAQSPIDYTITSPHSQKHRAGNAILNEMRRLNLMGHLSHEKVIPSEYLWDSIENRQSLLQGLIDSDGHVSPIEGNIEYSSSSPQLAKDIRQLIQSLGGTANIRPKKTTHRTRTKYFPCRLIAKIEKVGLKETQCISVDSPDNLYVTDDFILTHNTVQALGFVNALRANDSAAKNILVLAPSTLAFNWKNEAEKWLCKPMEIIIPKSGKFEIPARDNLFVITNYEKISGNNLLSESLKRIWDVLVCDEAHALKTWKTKRTQAVLGHYGLFARAKRTAFLTGTPMENYPKEIWTIAASICPAKFGDWWEFAKRYCGLHLETIGNRKQWVDTGASNLGELQQRLRASFMIRRLKSDVLKELPPKRRQLITLDNVQIDWAKDPAFRRWRELYEKAYEAKLAAVEAAKTQEEYRSAVKSLDAFTGIAFQEMSEFRHQTALAKLPACMAYIDQILETGIDKLVIFAHHQDVLAKLAEHYGPAAVSLHGQTKPSDREAVVKRFQDGNARIFIGGLKAAGVGLNLYAASTVVFIEIDWNPAVLSQAEDRLCRIGQKKMVHVIHLIVDGTLDANICKKVVAKQQVIDKALNRPPEQGLEPTSVQAIRC